MARSGVTREQVFETAEALVREGQTPTVVAVRTRLGGGSPNTITPLLAEWKTLHEGRRAEAMPPPPEPVEAVLRQVWGAAWQQAQGQLEGEREALNKVREEIERERAEMLGEISRLDGDLEAARETIGKGAEALEAERRAHEQTRSQAREAQAVAAERAERIAGQEREIQSLREQVTEALGRVSRLDADLGHAARDLEAVRGELTQERQAGKRLSGELDAAQARGGRLEADLGHARQDLEALQGALNQARQDQANAQETLAAERRAHEQTRSQAREVRVLADEHKARIAELETALREERAGRRDQDAALTALRVEAATLAERAAHVDELRALVRGLQEQPGRAGDEARPKAPARRRSKPEKPQE